MADCEDVLGQLFEFIDRELPADEAASVRAHIEECGYCTSAERADRAFIECVRAKLRGSPVPPELAERLNALVHGPPR
ncbi:MAG: zf-HC2 domain-containing protein [Fimbriimonadaceae bacterium]